MHFLLGRRRLTVLAVQEVLHLLKNDRQFAVLMPLSLVPELSRLENSGGAQAHDLDVARKVDALSKIILPSSAQVWLVNLAQFAVTKVLTIMEEGAGLDEVERTFRESLFNLHDMMEQRMIGMNTTQQSSCLPLQDQGREQRTVLMNSLMNRRRLSSLPRMGL